MALAIFDLDNTLIAGDSDYAWGQYMADAGLVDAQAHQHQNDIFYRQYEAGNLDVDEYLRFACGALAAHSLDVLNEHLNTFVSERIKPMMLSKANDLVEHHRSQGDYLLVITATIEFVTRPIVDLFGIETLIAPIPELFEDRYTGGIVGVPAFGPGKVTRLKSWLEEVEHDLEGSFFYSDSHNDLPLLRQVDHPVAVDPDPKLRQEAEEQQWRIVSLR